MAAGQGVGAADQADGVETLAINADGIAVLETDFHHLGLLGSRIHTHGEGVDLLGRLHVGILQGTRLNRAPQQVEVNRIRRLLAHRGRDATTLAIGDRLLAAHTPFPGRGQHLEIGCQGANRHVEAHLVVALAGAAMGHGIRTNLAGDLHQTASDQGTRQGRGERVAAFVESVGTNRRKGEVADEGLDQVTNDRLACPGIQRLLTDGLELIPLPQIGGEGNHLLHAPLVFEIRNTDAGIHTTGIRQHSLLGPAHQRSPCAQSTDSPLSRWRASWSTSQRAIPSGGSRTNAKARTTAASGRSRAQACANNGVGQWRPAQTKSPLTTRATPQAGASCHHFAAAISAPGRVSDRMADWRQLGSYEPSTPVHRRPTGLTR